MAGRRQRNGISMDEVFKMFSTERKAEKWFYNVRWGKTGIHCPRCGSLSVLTKTKHPTMPYQCRECRKFFSLKTGTVMESSNFPLSKWGKGIYMMTTEIKGRASIKIARDLGIEQKRAWHLMHRIREAYACMILKLITDGGFTGVTEIDETAVGGKVKSMNRKSYRSFKERGGGTGFKGKEIVIGAKNRETGKVVAAMIDDRSSETLQTFVENVTQGGSTVVTDEARGYKNMSDRKHMSVNHSIKQFVNGMASTNGVESFWSIFKRGLEGIYHKVSPKHLSRYIFEFSGRFNDRPKDTIRQMELIAAAMVGRRLTYADLIKPTGKYNAGNMSKLDKDFKIWSAWDEVLSAYYGEEARDKNEALQAWENRPQIQWIRERKQVAQPIEELIEEAFRTLDWEREDESNQLGLAYENLS